MVDRECEGWEVPGRSRGEGKRTTEPDERSGDDGGHDGDDEGECGYDGAADVDYGVD